MTYSRAVRVLHSMKAPDAETKYATHMAAVAGDGVEAAFFTWPRALFGRYDIFHLHWPEALVGRGSGPKLLATTVLSALLRLRLRLARTPVVYTLHNRAPHETKSARQLRARRAFERLASIEIHLVPEPDRVAAAESVTIPHGSYVEPYAAHPRSERVAGRAHFFGLMRPYKGIEELLDAFAAVPGADTTLRLVGKPMDPDLAAAIERRAASDPRVGHRFGFIPDRDLVAEVTAAQLVVLPYRELHSSGAVLVALSLGRPVLIPDSVTGRALRDEAGADWVRLFEGPLTADVLSDALAETRTPPTGSPDLSARTWPAVREAHVRVYRRALELRGGGGGAVFAWLSGQDDNLGDSALRRGYAEALRARGDLVAYVADASPAYISGLGLGPADRVTPSLGAWLRDALAAARRGPATLAINAGEFTFSGRYTLQMMRILPALWRFRRRGGAVVWLGAAVPGPRRGRTWLFRRLFRAADLVRWRDARTSEVFEPAPAMPDWALALEATGPSAERGALGVSLRFDRPYPSEAWRAAVRELAGRLGLEIVAVAQVARDTEYARRLAADLGGRAVEFRAATAHAVHETVLRGEYAAMRLILSDRLHALLIAMSEGAVPLGLAEASTEKLVRHFDALGLPWATAPADERIARLSALDDAVLAGYADDASRRLADARRELGAVRELLAGDQWLREAARAKTRA